MADLQPGQFSQPHLPGMHVKPTDEHRYPRGYTPERMQEVRAELPSHRIYVSNQNPGEIKPGDEYAPHHHMGAFSGHLAEGPRPHMGRMEGEAKVMEAVARSTVPTSDLRGVTINVQPRRDEFDPAGQYSEIGFGGKPAAKVFMDPAYDAPSPATAKNTAPTQRRRQGNEQTLIHELGHHASSLAGNEHHSYDTPEARGQEEAFADDYKSQHYRPDRRDARRSPLDPSGYDKGGARPQDPYPGGGIFNNDEAWNNNESFGESYLAHRQFPNKYVDRTPQVPRYPSGITKLPGDPDIEGQGRLFMRQGRDAKDTTPDYGQHPLMDNDKQPLPTIKLGRGVRG